MNCPHVAQISSTLWVSYNLGQYLKEIYNFFVFKGNKLHQIIKNYMSKVSILCPKCGCENKANSNVCVLCGSKLEESVSENIIEKMRKYMKPINKSCSIDEIKVEIRKFRNNFEKELTDTEDLNNERKNYERNMIWKNEFDYCVRAIILEIISYYSKIAQDKLRNIIELTPKIKKNTELLIESLTDGKMIKELSEYRVFIDSINIPIKEIVNYSFFVKESEFRDHISLALTNMRRRLDRTIRELIVARIMKYSTAIKLLDIELKEIKKDKFTPSINKTKIISKIQENLKQLKLELEKDMKILIEISYDVKNQEFSDRIEKNTIKISKNIDKILSKLNT